MEQMFKSLLNVHVEHVGVVQVVLLVDDVEHSINMSLLHSVPIHHDPVRPEHSLEVEVDQEILVLLRLLDAVARAAMLGFLLFSIRGCMTVVSMKMTGSWNSWGRCSGSRMMLTPPTL